MRVAYIDMIGGAAGDMLMGAWIDAGLDAAELERALRSVVADGWELTTERVVRAGISATYLDLVIPGEDLHAHGAGGHHHHVPPKHGYRLRDVLTIVERSALPPPAIARASAIFRRLADAEARVSGADVEEMLFHEGGQIDAILDVAGTCAALEILGIERIRASAFPIGHGMSHGFPNPGPVALELMRGFPVRSVDLESQLVTETGAAILATIAAPGLAPDMRLERVGYGAGRRNPALPNVVRVMIGEAVEP